MSDVIGEAILRVVTEYVEPEKTVIKCGSFVVDIDGRGFGKIIKDGVELTGVCALKFSFDHSSDATRLPMVELMMFPDIDNLNGKTKKEKA